MKTKKKATPIDWPQVLFAWCEARVKDPNLTCRAFAKKIGRNYNTIRQRCSNQLAELYVRKTRDIPETTRQKSGALLALELWERLNDHSSYEPAVQTPEKNQNSLKHGYYSEYVAVEDIDATIEFLGGDVNVRDEIILRAKLRGVLRDGHELDLAEEKVRKRIAENDGVATDVDEDDLIRIDKARRANIDLLDRLQSRINNTRLDRLREDYLKQDTRVKKFTADKLEAESGGSDELDLDELLDDVDEGNA